MTAQTTKRLLLLAGFLLLSVVVLSLAVGMVGGWPWMMVVAEALGIGAVLWLIVWFVWKGIRLLLFRVGRRLAFSYFLIGVLPIPMVASLILLNAYLLSGYFLGHLYRDSLHSLQDDLERVAALRLGGDRAASESAAGGGERIAFAEYRAGQRIRDDERFPASWPAWLDSLDSAEADGLFVGLADGTPTLAAAAGSGSRGVVALYARGIETELSRRAGVWVQLYRADDPRQESRIHLQILGRRFALSPVGGASDRSEERTRFFATDAPAADGETPYVDRPLVWWGELSGSLRSLADGGTMSEYVTASLNGTPRMVARHLFSGAAEVNTAVWAGVISITSLLAMFYVVAVFMATIIIFTLSRAVNHLSRATNAVRAGDFAARIPVRRRDQVGELQRSFNEMAANLESLVATAAQKEALEKELSVARALQSSLLPKNLPGTDRLDFATLFEPSAAIGGDYFDILSVGERVAVVVADVAGHGLPAGLQMAMLKAALLMLVEESKPPTEILARLDKMIRTSDERRFFVTAAVAMIDPASGELEITNAGHPPTYLLRGGEVEEIVLPGSPLGTLGDNYGRTRRTLEPDDVAIWISDGLIEATNHDDEPFGYERVRQALGGSAASASEVRDRLLAALDRHLDGLPAADDRTLVAMRYCAVAAASSSPSEA